MKQRIAHFRKARGLTQQQLADEVGVTLSMIGKLERDERTLTFEMAEDIARVLDVYSMDLIEFEDDLRVKGFLSEGGRLVVDAQGLGIIQNTVTTDDFELPGPLAKCEFNVQTHVSLVIPIGSTISTRLKQRPLEEAFLGKLSMVGIEGQKDPILAIILRGSSPSLYHLAVVGGPPLQDQDISWACPIDEIHLA